VLLYSVYEYLCWNGTAVGLLFGKTAAATAAITKHAFYEKSPSHSAGNGAAIDGMRILGQWLSGRERQKEWEGTPKRVGDGRKSHLFCKRM
jgi:hypothetical protein